MVNLQDNQGNTSLHLAIKHACNFPNTRSLKELLIKGADRDILNKQGQKPIDLSIYITDSKLKEEVRSILERDTSLVQQFMPCC
mmetsp:Transcript_30955/g.22517  ORF Transcript_30955/g.22517 Transcript_30955/m.22517 type:complete len:84 (-) Transcript_30955:1245-1496(-)